MRLIAISPMRSRVTTKCQRGRGAIAFRERDAHETMSRVQAVERQSGGWRDVVSDHGKARIASLHGGESGLKSAGAIIVMSTLRSRCALAGSSRRTLADARE